MSSDPISFISSRSSLGDVIKWRDPTVELRFPAFSASSLDWAAIPPIP